VERNDQVVEAAPAIVAEEVARSTGDFRMADVATRLGVSERTLARYFGGRDGLVREAAAVRDASFASRLARSDGGSSALAGSATTAVRNDTAHVPLMRLAELAAEGRSSHVDGARRAAFGDLAASVSRELGTVDGISSEQMVLALIAVAAFPTAFPRWASVITGSEIDTDDFRARHRAAVDAIADRLTGRTQTATAPLGVGAVGGNGPSLGDRVGTSSTVDLTSRIDLTGGASTSGTPLAASTQHLVQRASALAEQQGASEVSPTHLFAALRAMAPDVVARANSTSNGGE
jgi:AcrR family transcriptional regulator